MNKNDTAGQLYFNAHKAFEFNRCMRTVFMKMESEIRLHNLLCSFISDLSIDQCSDLVSLSVISWMLNLFGIDMVTKP